MSSRSLREIEACIDQLDWPDQLRLLEYLAPRIAKAAAASNSQSTTPAAPAPQSSAWQRYRELGTQLAATSTPDAPSLTEAVSQMRR